MDKKAALKILIEHSFLLTEAVKAQFVSRIPNMSDAQIEILGKILAEEKKQSLKLNAQKIKSLEGVIKNLITKI